MRRHDVDNVQFVVLDPELGESFLKALEPDPPASCDRRAPSRRRAVPPPSPSAASGGATKVLSVLLKLAHELDQFGDGPRPDQSEVWRTTLASAQRVLGRVGAIRDIAVPPVIRHVIDVLSKGLPMPDDKWQALEAAYVDALMYTAGLRPGRMNNDGAASAHVLAYHDLSRLTELLLLWRHDDVTYPQNR